MLRFCDERLLCIGNGRDLGDRGDFTFISHFGTRVLDYVLVPVPTDECVVSMNIGSSVESDHSPLEVVMKVTREPAQEEEQGVPPTVVEGEETESYKRAKWSDECRRDFVASVVFFCTAFVSLVNLTCFNHSLPLDFVVRWFGKLLLIAGKRSGMVLCLSRSKPRPKPWKSGERSSGEGIEGLQERAGDCCSGGVSG